MERKQDICPYCGGTEMGKGKQFYQGAVYRYDAITLLKGRPLIHIICKSCGTVVRSYVDDPEDLKDLK